MRGSWGIRRIINGCAAQQLVARRDASAPELIRHRRNLRPKALCVQERMPEPRCGSGRWGGHGGAVHGLSGVVPMVYFHFFAAAPSSQLSWLGATLFITGIFVLFRFRPRPYIARASHDTKA